MKGGFIFIGLGISAKIRKEANAYRVRFFIHKPG